MALPCGSCRSTQPHNLALRAFAARLRVRRLHCGPRARFDALVASGVFRGGDAPQSSAADALQELYEALLAHSGRWRRKGAPKGVYLHGGVGRGKTALLDAFHASLQQAGVPSQRTHAHAWMLDLHAALHETPRSVADPLDSVAARIAASTRVLCLDELEVTDVADAVLLRRIYGALRARGTVLATTSNAAPEALYAGGLNRRELFEPFVAALSASCNVVCLDGGVDYRVTAGGDDACPLLYMSSLGAATERRCDAAFAALAPADAAPATAVDVSVPGTMRSVRVPLASGRVARFTFRQLCGSTSSAADYLALCGAFDAFLLTDVPARRSEDELRRFINLVDLLYDAGKLLVLTAEVPLHALFAAEADEQVRPAAVCASQLGLTGGGALTASGISVSGAGGASGRSTTMVGGVEWSATGRLGASLAHLASNGGSFACIAAPRAASRLRQMTRMPWAEAWAARHHAPPSWLALLRATATQVE